MFRHLLYFLFFVFFIGCAQEVTVDQKFVNLFVELRVIEMTYGKDAPIGRLVRQDALKAAGYTREQFLANTEEILNDERQWIPSSEDSAEPAPKEPVKKKRAKRGGDD